MNLRKQAFTSIRWTSVSTIFRNIISLVQLGLLARILEPSDFGLMAAAMSVIIFIQIFSDLGISNALIHHQNISKEIQSSLYWTNVLASLLLMLALMSASGLVSFWYQETRLQMMLVYISSSFLIGALGQQLIVLAEKNLKFRSLALIEIASSTLNLIVAVFLALSGAGVYSLVFGLLASSILKTALAWIFLADGWHPQLRLKLSEIREFLGFGAYMIGFSLTNSINSQADIFIGGRMLGVQYLGAYSLPKNLSLRVGMIFNSIVTRVGRPLMAKAQDNPALLKSIYLKTLRMTCSVNFPVYMMLLVFAPEIVVLLFGDKWIETIPLLRILALWGLIRSTGNPSGSLLFALGKSKLAFYWSLGLLLITLPSLYFGSLNGVVGLAYGMLIIMVLIPIPQWYFLIFPNCKADFLEYFIQMLIPLFLSIFALIFGYFSVVSIDLPLLRLVIGGAISAIAYVTFSYLFNRSWIDSMMELVFISKKSSSQVG